MKKRYLHILVPLAVAVILAIWYLPFFLESRVSALLADHGMKKASVEKVERKSDEITLSDIMLDPDGFSSIGSIRARADWIGLLSKNFLSEVVIDKLVLTGEMDEAGRITIAGWEPYNLLTTPNANTVIVNDGQIDLATPIGAIRLEAKAHMTKQEDKSQKVEATVWGKQHQLAIDTMWDVSLQEDGAWTAFANIWDARMDLENMNFSRLNGWLSFESSAASAMPSISGQIMAGKMQIGKSSGLNDANITLAGPPNAWRIIVSGKISGYQGASMTAEVSPDPDRADGRRRIYASLEALKAADLFTILQNLNADMAAAFPRVNILTPLMITPGNIQRLKQSIDKIKYDSVELVIDGSPFDLTGKIIAKRMQGGDIRTDVFSMDPGLSAAKALKIEKEEKAEKTANDKPDASKPEPAAPPESAAPADDSKAAGPALKAPEPAPAQAPAPPAPAAETPEDSEEALPPENPDDMEVTE